MVILGLGNLWIAFNGRVLIIAGVWIIVVATIMFLQSPFPALEAVSAAFLIEVFKFDYTNLAWHLQLGY